MYKDIICFSHLRWNFVYQRPQHLLSRFAQHQRVFYIEEPIYDSDISEYRMLQVNDNLWTVVPHLRPGLSAEMIEDTLRELLDDLIHRYEMHDCILWYYNPMAFGYSRHLDALLFVYDCMDELTGFRFAPPELRAFESLLLQRADLVLTGGYSLYEAKKSQHPAVYAFPSSIDKEHFVMARQGDQSPADQQPIPFPRLGYYGVIDERIDLQLLSDLALLRNDLQFILIGPTAKINVADLPRHQNIHYLGMKSYNELPAYLSGWDVAIMPFAINEATTFISPTKTPEYLAGGKPVISTAIQDVVQPYANLNLVYIAETADQFSRCADIILQAPDPSFLSNVDGFLKHISWEETWTSIHDLLHEKLIQKNKLLTHV